MFFNDGKNLNEHEWIVPCYQENHIIDVSRACVTIPSITNLMTDLTATSNSIYFYPYFYFFQWVINLNSSFATRIKIDRLSKYFCMHLIILQIWKDCIGQDGGKLLIFQVNLNPYWPHITCKTVYFLERILNIFYPYLRVFLRNFYG